MHITSTHQNGLSKLLGRWHEGAIHAMQQCIGASKLAAYGCIEQGLLLPPIDFCLCVER